MACKNPSKTRVCSCAKTIEYNNVQPQSEYKLAIIPKGCSGIRQKRTKKARLHRAVNSAKDDIPAIFYKHYPAFSSGGMNVSELARVWTEQADGVQVHMSFRIKNPPCPLRTGGMSK